MRILHSGDWHIGTFAGPEINGQNARMNDICKCLDALVARATIERPDITIIAGDIFHQAKVWADRGLRENRIATFYIRRLSKISPVVILRGTPNHDSAEQFENLENAFYADDSVHIITKPEMRKIYSYSGKAVQIAAVPGFDRGYFRAMHPGLSKEEENAVFTEALENIILGLKAECEAGIPTVLVSHFTIPGCNTESGQTQFFSQFEPVVNPSTLSAADFDLNCFGHIHRPQRVEEAYGTNTFYCGAVSALNFNDEGQERGFYIHDINDDRTVHSEFHALPTREFYTIRLEDEDVEAINEGDTEWLTKADSCKDFPDKIVRVIYNCTDEHNKAFNKAALEQFLYNNGAFWVQEITPERITITANKDNLSDENGPEENLRQYFEEKEYSAEKIAAIIEAARPIIAEATERNTAHGNTGIFTPLKIEVKNYRNYREEAFDYSGIRFCTINGENGAGKSSLFMDAMLDALYEEPREGDLTGWICNDPEIRSGAIQFTFSVGERIYRVARTRQKSGKATLNISEMVDGEWQDRSAEKYRDTQNIINEIVGMDSLTFKACALIMQDQYGLFLQADKEARMNILGNVLGLGIYETMEDIAADNLTRRNRDIRTLQERVNDIISKLPDAEELAAEIKATEANLANFQKNADAKAAEIDSIKVRFNTKREAAVRATRIQQTIANRALKLETATANKTSQMLIANGAAATIAEAEAIKAGVAEYEALLEKEKSLTSARDRYDDLLKQRDKLKAEIDSTIAEISRAAIEQERKRTAFGEVAPIIANEDHLKALHAEYEKTKAELAYLQRATDEHIALTERENAAKMAYSKLDNQIAVERNRLAAELKNLSTRVALLDNSGCPIAEKASCRFLADALEAKEAIPAKQAEIEAFDKEAAERLAEAQNSVDLAREAVKANNYNPEEINSLKAILRGFEDSEKKYAALDRAKEDAKRLNEEIIALEEKRNSLNEKKIGFEEEYNAICASLADAAEAANAYDTLATEIKRARVWLEKEKELSVARERFATADARVTELDEEIKALETEIAELKAEHAHETETAEGAAELEKVVIDAENVINYLQSEIKIASMKLGALRKKEEDAAADRETVKELNKQTESLGALAAIDEDLKKAFSQDGIPHNVIRSIIPIFESTATAILGQMSGGRMSVEFVTEKLLKSNNKKEVTTLDIIINDAITGRLPYMSRSGGERVKSALSVILALSEIKSTKAGVQLGFLFVDEPPFLDGQGVQSYCDALEAIQSRYASLKIMAITHDPTMKSRFPQSIDVVKTADGSKIIYQ